MAEEAARRDVGNHVLFEVATEVANRGQQSQHPHLSCER